MSNRQPPRKGVRDQHGHVNRVGATLGFIGAAIAVGVNIFRALGIVDNTLYFVLIVASALTLIAALIRLLLASSRRTAIVIVAVTIALVAGLTFVVYVYRGKNHAGVEGISGGCATFIVYSQNRWQPYGVLIRLTPYRLSPVTGPEGFPPNAQIPVDGWVSTEPLNAGNVEPFNAPIWYHLADGRGWVPYAGVRAVPTSPDPENGFGSGGQAAPTPGSCSGGLQ